MVTLRLDQSVLADGRHRVTVRLDDGGAPQVGVSDFAFTLTDDDREDVRWYLEDFLEYPLDPAPVIAERVERRLTDIGTELFRSVFAEDTARDAWASIRNQLGEVRIEVGSDVDGAAVLPWELLVDPRTEQPVALQVESFVRVNHRRAVTVPRQREAADKLRVLLVICRPGGSADVPFRSVASHLIRLGGSATEVFDLDVLRPPTFRQLTVVLEAAQRAGRPYHVVHFDGHGAYVDVSALRDGAVTDLSRNSFGVLPPVRSGPHGYLVFEDPENKRNQMLVGGSAVGALLARTGVSVLLLNACRSAYAEAPPAPGAGAAQAAGDVHARVRAYGSLALEATDAGLPGVVAMRYNVYVVTAAQFVADLYTALLEGQPLGAAVSAGRRQLAANPQRTIAFQARALQDWSVPVVYEAAPLPVLAQPGRATQPRITVSTTGGGGRRPAGAGVAADGLPFRPDVGFFGRDETLLALDRAFDRHRIVLLHAYAGSGKTSTAVEFARWYAGTGGLADDRFRDGVVVFSSLEHYTPLARLLNEWAAVFEPLLHANQVQWDAINDHDVRRAIALEVMAQVPVLWIWDNVEPVAGFPAGTASAWPAEEQTELADFLRDLRRTKARVLLTSRREEQGWLGQLPRRVPLPPMPMRERIQLTQAIAELHGHHIGDVEDWRPLLRYTAGNPLTVTVLVSQALRTGLTRTAQIEAFVAQLRAGEADLPDDEAEGRSASLGASLGYGFAAAFTEAERAQLALLHLFQDSVDVDALAFMGHPGSRHPVPALAGLTREDAVALLDRAAELGLLTPLGAGYYTIHPALPWYFRHLYATHHRDAGAEPDGAEPDGATVAAYTAAIASLGNHYQGLYARGRVETIHALRLEEANLLHARSLARAAGRWDDVMGCMQGLSTLYEHLERRAEWIRLVDELTPELVDPATDGPRPDRAKSWPLHTHYRIRIAIDTRDWAPANHLQETALVWHREQAVEALATPTDQLTGEQRQRIHELAVSEHTMGDMLREQEDPECVTHLLRSIELKRHIGAFASEAVTAANIGTAYVELVKLRDPDQAERWFEYALERYEGDRLGLARVTMQLGRVAYERFVDARAANEPDEVLVNHLTAAARRYHDALDALPAEVSNDRAVVHNQLGVIYRNAGQLDAAVGHYQQSIKYEELAGNRYGAGQSRFNVALMLAGTGRTDDALLYANAALRDFRTYGPNAAQVTDKTERLIALLEEALATAP